MRVVNGSMSVGKNLGMTASMGSLRSELGGVMRSSPLTTLRRVLQAVRCTSSAVVLFAATLSAPAAHYHDSTHETKLFASPEKLGGLLRGWAEQKPELARVEVIGTSWMSRPPFAPDTPTCDLLALHVTDSSVPEEDKQVAVIAGMRVVFSVAPSLVLHTTRWLLSEEPLAIETRRRQHLIFVPSARPYYQAIGGMVLETLYDNWTWEGVQNPETNIEAAAIQHLLDTWQPEVFVDLSSRVVHREAMVMEAVGLRGRSALSSCYVPEVPLLLRKAAAAGGYQVHDMHPHYGHGVIPSPLPLPGADAYYYLRSWKVLPTDYAYRHYHTLGLPVIASFRESFLLMMKALCRIGNDTWAGERSPGYPTRVVGGAGPVMVAAWGTNAAQQRVSRCELWRKKNQVGISYTVDPHPNAVVAIVTTDPARIPEWFAPGPRSYPGSSAVAVFDILENIENADQADRMKLDAVRGVLARHWRGSRYTFRPQGWQQRAEDPTVRHGLNLRCLFPYLAPEIREVRLDGHPLEPSLTSGYHVIHGPGTIVEIAIPPGRVRDVHVVSVEIGADRPFEDQSEGPFRELP